jgi:hypothetical protein
MIARTRCAAWEEGPGYRGRFQPRAAIGVLVPLVRLSRFSGAPEESASFRFDLSAPPWNSIPIRFEQSDDAGPGWCPAGGAGGN